MGCAGFPARPGDQEHPAVIALVRVRGPRSDELAHRPARQQLDTRSFQRLDDIGRDPDVRNDDVAGAGLGGGKAGGGLARVTAGGSTRESFGAASVTVMPASIESPIGWCESADSPDGRSIETIGMPDAFTSATTVSMRPDSGAFRPVPKIESTMSVQSPISEK